MDVRLSLRCAGGDAGMLAFLREMAGLAVRHGVDVVGMRRVVEEDLMGALGLPAAPAPPAASEEPRTQPSPDAGPMDAYLLTKALVEGASAGGLRHVQWLGEVLAEPKTPAPFSAEDVVEYLATANAHPRDARLTFDEAGHVYTIQGDAAAAAGPVTSVTGLATKSQAPFNPDMAAGACVRSARWKSDPTYDYYGMEQADIKALWEFERELGTELHRDAELYLNAAAKHGGDAAAAAAARSRFLQARLSTDLLHCDRRGEVGPGEFGAAPEDAASPVVQHFTPEAGRCNLPQRARKAYARHLPDAGELPDAVAPAVERQYLLNFLEKEVAGKGLRPYRTEWRLWDQDFRVAGTVDLICERAGGGSAPTPKGPKPVVMFDWKRSKKHKPLDYGRQMNLYKWLLERHYGVEVQAMYIVRLHPNADDYDLLEIECGAFGGEPGATPLEGLAGLPLGLDKLLKGRYEAVNGAEEEDEKKEKEEKEKAEKAAAEAAAKQ
eukprot:TRINITY_DN1306_c0_g3_i1.p1 TRINITY_DN1306_c0_g3~~TRINITY_DN1306_c0_g3_i1.p1  ORF type:complete len:528 (+),score=225.08 TRINITY_DN1306_c0_g3_i1:104-1585(+)